ncbi:MAG TPA: hypothetical protein VK874_07785 [Gaiellaceae bacterium]|nr:hypothetical protein [Gaiellaceae bacterium]
MALSHLLVRPAFEVVEHRVEVVDHRAAEVLVRTGSKTAAGGGPTSGVFANTVIAISVVRSGLVAGHGERSPRSKSRRSQSPYWKSKLGG